MPATRSVAAVGPQQGGDGAHERGLAGAVGAEHGGDGAGRGDEVEAVEGDDVAEPLAQPDGLDRRVACDGERCDCGHAAIIRAGSGHPLTTSAEMLVRMRADRLVATLLVLQAKGRVTAAELADELRCR